jgi:hypothetical protein
VSALLDEAPYAPRDEAAFLAEAIALTRAHLDGCADYRAIWPDVVDATTVAELPWLHVGVFKRLRLRTDAPGVKHQRVLLSSATTSGTSSQVALDELSGKLQARSSQAILEDFVGAGRRPLVVLDDAASLRQRGQVSARVAAALSLVPLASTTTFALDAAGATRWDAIAAALADTDAALVYGFTWALWQSWAQRARSAEVRDLLRTRRLCFVHSGGWKKLEAAAVDRATFDRALTGDAGPGSLVVDFYGLVEQNGIVFPMCEQGVRHVPRWADVIVRDPWTLAPLPPGQTGMLQLVNVLAHGAPYHSVLTEDLGELVAGDCACGRRGPRFHLRGRVPRAELRGCAVV